jgi:transposase InsO family protein
MIMYSIAARIINIFQDWLHSFKKKFLNTVRPASSIVTSVANVAVDSVKTRPELLLENALLRQQLIVLSRSVKRPKITNTDRIAMVFLSRFTHRWRGILHIVSPDTLLRWHRDLFKIIWRRKSKRKSHPRRLSQDTIDLIGRIAMDNKLWGAERIRGELLKLNIHVTKRTIQKYVSQFRPTKKSGQTWETFLKNHSNDISACDFLQLYDVLFRPIFAFFIIKHGNRDVVHFHVTRSPNDKWTAQQLREATPYCEGPKYLIRDNDGKYGREFSAAAEGAGIEVVKIPPKSPNLNPICERFLGSVRRECLDHILILNEKHLYKVLSEYVVYFRTARPHQGLEQRMPQSVGEKTKSTAQDNEGKIISLPVLGGLHHEYKRVA